MDKLSEFVAEQLRRGVSSSEIRLHLLQNGWGEADVNQAISNATSGRTRKNVIIAVVSLLIVGILVFSLLALAKNTNKNINPTSPNIPQTPNAPNTPNSIGQEMQTEPLSVEGCSDKESSLEKDTCYKQFLRTGFDCQTLTDKVELTYCNRAYEDIVLQGVEIIEEN